MFTGGVGGLSELVVANEEWGIPIWTDLPETWRWPRPTTTCAYGMGAAFNQAPVFPGADVVVIGCGLVGAGRAVQGARLREAGQIIAIEPIAEQRELARKFGATTVLDPFVVGDKLVETIRDMCKGPTDRISRRRPGVAQRRQCAQGSRLHHRSHGRREQHPPKGRPSPDPTGVLPMLQAWGAHPRRRPYQP